MSSQTTSQKAAVFVASAPVGHDAREVRGPDFGSTMTLIRLLESFSTTGMPRTKAYPANSMLRTCIFSLPESLLSSNTRPSRSLQTSIIFNSEHIYVYYALWL